MQWGRIVIVIATFLATFISFVVGKLWGSSAERKAHEPIRQENQKLRDLYAQLTSFFEERTYNYEKIIAQIFDEKPSNKEELSALLKRYSLSDKEIERVSSMLAKADFYNPGAK